MARVRFTERSGVLILLSKLTIKRVLNKNVARVGFAERSGVLILLRMSEARSWFSSGQAQRSTDSSQYEVLKVFSVNP